MYHTIQSFMILGFTPYAEAEIKKPRLMTNSKKVKPAQNEKISFFLDSK